MPKVITLPSGMQLPYHGTVRGTSSGYVGFTTGDGGRWQSFDAVLWHGGVDVFLGTYGGRMWEVSPGSRLLVIFLRRCIGWAGGGVGPPRRGCGACRGAGPIPCAR